jgi:hypothetical protein
MRLYWSIIAKHSTPDAEFIFHVMVGSDAGFVPRSFQILDLDTGEVSAPFPLAAAPEDHYCQLYEAPDLEFFETSNIFDHLPTDFRRRFEAGRGKGESFDWLIEVEHSSGLRESVVITDQPKLCTDIIE